MMFFCHCTIYGLILSIFCASSSITSASNNAQSVAYSKAIDFISKFQNPEACVSPTYGIVNIGVGGGFAAHFQLAASDFMRGAAATNFSVPILIMGQIKGYSTGEDCQMQKGDWTCYFLPVSKCQEKLLTGSKAISLPEPAKGSSFLPPQFELNGQGLSLAWWWGVIQKYMFQLQPNVEALIKAKGIEFRNRGGFPSNSSVIGVHVRHGDKRSDGFIPRSFAQEINAIKIPKGVNASVSMEGNNKNINVFVASDDLGVLKEANRLGFMTNSAGVSQSTSSVGMFATLNNKPVAGIAFNASMEIISDIYYLSQCVSLVGTASSQVYRMAVDMSNATGLLETAVAIDFDQIPRIRHMSARWGLPVPEDWSRA